jgi:hypothetical protein
VVVVREGGYSREGWWVISCVFAGNVKKMKVTGNAPWLHSGDGDGGLEVCRWSDQDRREKQKRTMVLMVGDGGCPVADEIDGERAV